MVTIQMSLRNLCQIIAENVSGNKEKNGADRIAEKIGDQKFQIWHADQSGKKIDVWRERFGNSRQKNRAKGISAQIFFNTENFAVPIWGSIYQ